MKQALHVQFTHDVQVLAYFLYEYYSDVKSEFPKTSSPAPDVMFVIEETVNLRYWHKSEMLEIEWESSGKSDMIADSVCLLCLQLKD